MSHSSRKSSPRKSSQYLQWFYNLPIRRKQLFGLFASEVISVVGLVGVGIYLIVAGGRQQLLQQVKSEIAVTTIQYNIKVNQMGFGFRGQADNAAIITAAQAYQQDQALPADLHQQIRDILQNELNARDIEYATLVGPDLRVIANAADNRDRTGETFDPNHLVSEVLANPTQIKTSEFLSWQQLSHENPPLPQNFAPQDVLVRYTATPVLSRHTQSVIGVLISGDIVNGKLPIVQQTVTTLNGGYSAIYLVNQTGTFTPVALFDGEMMDSEVSDGKGIDSEVTDGEMVGNADGVEAIPNLAQADRLENVEMEMVSDRLLEEAIAAQGNIVTGRDRIGDTSYTIAAQAILNHAGTPIAVLVRGTSESALNALLRNNLSTQLVITMIALAADIGLAIVLGFALIEPTRRLQQTAQAFANGDLKRRAEVFATDEVGQLTVTFNNMADSLVKQYNLEEQVEVQKQLNEQLQQEITERQRTEAQLQLSQAELLQKNKLLEQTLHDLKAAQGQMVQSAKMSSLGQLVAGIAHEINNPVSFIHGNLPYFKDYTQDLLQLIQLYQQQYPNPTPSVQQAVQEMDLAFIQQDLPKMMDSMVVGTQRICTIVTSLRTFARSDDSDVSRVDIHAGLESTLLILQHRLKMNHKLKRPPIQVVKDYGNLPPVECYSGPLNQVFMNILANAIDVLEDDYLRSSTLPSSSYLATETAAQTVVQPVVQTAAQIADQTADQTADQMANQIADQIASQTVSQTVENSGCITISTRALSSDWVEIAIADNGPGIPLEIQQKVFDPFFTTKPIGEGTGFGLSISYQIITEKHGGTLECRSYPTQGTMFVMRIPTGQRGDRSPNIPATTKGEILPHKVL